MRIKLINYILIIASLFGINIDAHSSRIDESNLSKCFNKKLIDKINHIRSSFNVRDLFYKNYKSKRLKLLNTNRLSTEEIETLLSQSKKSNLCGAYANDALGSYILLVQITNQKLDNCLSININYSKKAKKIYHHLANQESVDAVRLLCIPDDTWLIAAIDKPTLKVCYKALYSKSIKLTDLDRAMIFAAIFNSDISNMDNYSSYRADFCHDFIKNKTIMSYYNNWKKGSNKNNCKVESILYGEQLFVEKKYPEAFEYLSMFDLSSIKSGVPQFALGYMYQQGVGTIQNYKLALDWYMKSCSQTINPEAQFNLGLMYMRGNGVIRNYIIAHALFNLASANSIENAADMRNRIASNMSKEQIDKAQELAELWKKNWPNKIEI